MQNSVHTYNTKYASNVAFRKQKIGTHTYRGADKSLARPGWKQATATEGFYVHIFDLLS